MYPTNRILYKLTVASSSNLRRNFTVLMLKPPNRTLPKQIAQFRLADFVDQLTERYSHGMKQRLVFAAALVHEPRILVVDEPMVGLDPRSMKSIKDLMRRQANAGVTIFMSTHTLPVAEEISDRLGIFHRGRLQFLGTVPSYVRSFKMPTVPWSPVFADYGGIHLVPQPVSLTSLTAALGIASSQPVNALKGPDKLDGKRFSRTCKRFAVHGISSGIKEHITAR